MALFSGAGSRVASSVPAAAAAAAPWIQWLARFGYAARGVVYLLIGFLALQAAVSVARQPEDSSGALLMVLRQPFGRVLLGVLAVGLAGWVLWRLFQAFADPERLGTGGKGIVKRIGYVISAVLYGGLAVEAVRLLRTGASGGQGGAQAGGAGAGAGGEAAADHWTALVMAQPAGRWMIAGVGGVIIAFGVYEMLRAFRADFRRRLDLSSLSAAGERRVILFGRLGMAARAVVFGIIGWFLLRAALEYDPQEARGFQTALQTLEQQGYGQLLLGAVGVGLLCYGLFELAEARYRVIRTR